MEGPMRTNTEVSWRKLVLESIQGIFAGLDGQVSARDLANEACFSTFHFHRMFCAMTGETAGEMARRLRLERAAHMLNNTQTPVTEIAFEAGFETLEAFSRAFKATFGSSPTLYRRLKDHDGRALAPNTVHWSLQGAPYSFVPIEYKGDNMELAIKNINEIRLACVRHIGPYNQIGEAFGKLYEINGKQPFAKPEGPWIAIYLDNPDAVPPDQLRSEAGVQVAPDAVLPEGVTEVVIPAGKFATAIHRGSYSGLGEAWGAFCGKLIPEAGLEFRDGLCFELYLTDCSQVPESELLTELYEPVA